MNISNTLITIAYVSENSDNPYFVFCQYIKYCISTSANENVFVVDIEDKLKKEFGLKIPQNILIHCLRELKEEGFLRWDRKKHMCKAIMKFDTEEFDTKRRNFSLVEDELISELQKTVREYGLNWDPDHARSQLAEVLKFDHEAAKIFLGENTSLVGESPNTVLKDDLLSLDSTATIVGDEFGQPMIPDRVYTGRFIQKILCEDGKLKDYLCQVAQGIMVCIGAYQLPDKIEDKQHSLITNTKFFFDTRLLLRFVGIGSNASVRAIRELVRLIQINNGSVYYYEHTLAEMQKALQYAIDQLHKGDRPRDAEMALYANQFRGYYQVLELKKANLEQELSSKNIFKFLVPEFNDKDLLKHSFDKDDFRMYMENNTVWEKQSIYNDVESQWLTHMLRMGNYKDYYGGNNRLCIFVSSNERLMSLCLDYQKKRNNSKSIQKWSKSRLPIITDIKLTCRLWSPSDEHSQLPLLELAAHAIAAQQPTRKYYEKLRAISLVLHEQYPQLSGITLPEYFDDRITESLLRKSEGNEDNINVENVASSISELAQMNSIEQQMLNEELQDQIRNKNNEMEKQREQHSITIKKIMNNSDRRLRKQSDGIIRAAVKRNSWNMNIIWKIFLFLFENLYIVIAALFASFGAVLGYIVSVNSVLSAGIGVLLCGMMKIIELVLSKDYIKNVLSSVIIPKAIQHYKTRITNSLEEVEVPYKDKICELCLKENKFLKHYINQ